MNTVTIGQRRQVRPYPKILSLLTKSRGREPSWSTAHILMSDTPATAKTDFIGTRWEEIILRSGKALQKAVKAVHRSPRRYPKMLSEV